MRLYRIYRGQGLLNATVLAFDTDTVHKSDGDHDVYATLGAARSVLAAELRAERDAWGDAIRRCEAITLKNVIVVGPDPSPHQHSIGAVVRGAPGCTCGEPPFAPPEPDEDCPFHGKAATED